MVGFTMGINILVGAFVTSPDFDSMDKTALLDLQIQTQGALREELKPNFTSGTTCIDEKQAVLLGESLEGGTLIGILCNPLKQNIQTLTTQNSTTTSIVNTEVSSIGEQFGSVTDFSQTQIGSVEIVIKLLSGDFIFNAIGALFVDDIAEIPEEFIIGWKVIIGLMFAGLILSLVFGRNLAGAN